MQPNARRKSHRGIRRSAAPCSAANNHRVADASPCTIIGNYIPRTGRGLKGITVVESLESAVLDHCLLGASIWDLVIIPETCAGLGSSERSHPPPSAWIN